MKEIDNFLGEWATPALRPRGYRKASHLYRKQYPSGDWAVIGFRSYPLGLLGSFVVNVAFVPEPMFDWFNFAHPTMRVKAPSPDWVYWGMSLTPGEDYKWAYDTLAQRSDCGGRLVARLNTVADSFDVLATPGTAESFVANPEQPGLPGLSTLSAKLRFGMWRVCMLASHGPSAALDEELSACDPYPATMAREWVAHRFG